MELRATMVLLKAKAAAENKHSLGVHSYTIVEEVPVRISGDMTSNEIISLSLDNFSGN